MPDPYKEYLGFIRDFLKDVQKGSIVEGPEDHYILRLKKSRVDMLLQMTKLRIESRELYEQFIEGNPE